MGIPQVPDQLRKAPTLAIRAVFAGIGKILLAADRPPAGPRPDRPRQSGPKHAAPGRRPPRPSTAAGAAAPIAAGDSQRWRSLDVTGNVRLLSAEDLATGHGAVMTAGSAGATGQDQAVLTGQDQAVPTGQAQAVPTGQGQAVPTGQAQAVPTGQAQAVPTGQGQAVLTGQNQAAMAGDTELARVASRPLGGNVPIGESLVIHALPLPGYDTLSVASIRARLRGLDFDQLQALLLHEQKNAERPEIIAMIERRIEKLESGG